MGDSNPPLSLRVTRFLLWCGLIGGTLTYLVGGILVFFRQGFQENSTLRDPALSAGMLIGAAITIGLIAVALRGIQQRQSYGRWLSVSFLVLLVIDSLDKLKGSGALQIIFHALMQGNLPPPKGKLIDDFSFDNSFPIYVGYSDLARHAFGDALSAFLQMMLPGFLAIRLVFSQAAKRFFS